MNDFNEFLAQLAEAMTEFVEKIKETFEIVQEKIEELRDELFERDVELFERRRDLKERREAALLAGQRAAARAQAYGKQMQRDKARRALRRRKRLHVDGGLPDW